MAKRPIFFPDPTTLPYVCEKVLEFDWFPGFSKSQAQKSIRSLHREARKQGIDPMLEISSKSEQNLGISLSAFNLFMNHNGKMMSVECAFQGSKVFSKGGPYHDLYDATSLEAKKDVRLKEAGSVIAFNFQGEDFPTKPLTAFYDWLYLIALSQNHGLADKLKAYKGFSDIAFNPERSINCQARSAALFVALSMSDRIDLDRIVKDKQYYLGTITSNQNIDTESSEQLGFQF